MTVEDWKKLKIGLGFSICMIGLFMGVMAAVFDNKAFADAMFLMPLGFGYLMGSA